MHGEESKAVGDRPRHVPLHLCDDSQMVGQAFSSNLSRMVPTHGQGPDKAGIGHLLVSEGLATVQVVPLLQQEGVIMTDNAADPFDLPCQQEGGGELHHPSAHPPRQVLTHSYAQAERDEVLPGQILDGGVEPRRQFQPGSGPRASIGTGGVIAKGRVQDHPIHYGTGLVLPTFVLQIEDCLADVDERKRAPEQLAQLRERCPPLVIFNLVEPKDLVGVVELPGHGLSGSKHGQDGGDEADDGGDPQKDQRQHGAKVLLQLPLLFVLPPGDPSRADLVFVDEEPAAAVAQLVVPQKGAVDRPRVERRLGRVVDALVLQAVLDKCNDALGKIRHTFRLGLGPGSDVGNGTCVGVTEGAADQGVQIGHRRRGMARCRGRERRLVPLGRLGGANSEGIRRRRTDDATAKANRIREWLRGMAMDRR